MNSYSNLIFDGRAQGQFPVSVATSLALEGLFGILEDEPNPLDPPSKKVDHLLINFRTLFRNLHGSIEKDKRERLTEKDYAPVIIEELHLIRNLVSQYSEGKIEVDYYACTYNNLTGLYPYAHFKEVKTAGQKLYAALENATHDEVIRSLPKDQNLITRFDTTIYSVPKRTALVTHYPIDLLNVNGYNSLALLESHTGAFKIRPEWNTKLNNHKEWPRIPFDRMTVQMFGDTGGLFISYPIAYKKRLGELSEKYSWNGTTTKGRIIQCVEYAHDPELEAEVKRLYGL